MVGSNFWQMSSQILIKISFAEIGLFSFQSGSMFLLVHIHCMSSDTDRPSHIILANTLTLACLIWEWYHLFQVWYLVPQFLSKWLVEPTVTVLCAMSSQNTAQFLSFISVMWSLFNSPFPHYLEHLSNQQAVHCGITCKHEHKHKGMAHSIHES